MGANMKLTGTWLSATGAQAVFALLARAGFQAFAVGGCVRNSIMGAAVQDVDIATDARPETVMDLAAKAGLNAIPTGIDHGTVTVISDRVMYEITTFRQDIETDGRRAVVAFSKDMGTDAARRDFTMNALYADADGTVIDPLGGLPDINARRVRFIGEANARIAEDALRILRFFRFYALYGDVDAGIDADGLAACAGNLDLISGLSGERIGAEMKKLLSAPNPAPALASMAASGVLLQVCPGADASLIAPLVAVENGALPGWERRLRVMTQNDVSMAWKLSRKEVKRLYLLSKTLNEGGGTAALAYRFGADAAQDAGLIHASLGAQLPTNSTQEIARGASAKFPIRAADLMPRLKPGPALGVALKRLETAWVASDFTLTRDQLRTLAKQKYDH